MTSLHRLTVSTLAVALAALMTALAPGTATASTPVGSSAPTSTAAAAVARSVPAVAPAGSTSATADMTADLTKVNCSSIRELGSSRVVRDKGMSAFTVRQYIGWCWDSGGSAWMNFSSVYVWAQYHALGFGYRAQTGIVVGGGGDTRGYAVGDNRQRLTYSIPVRTVSFCTQGWGKLLRSGSESAQGITSLVC
ncbi:MAG TPA: hypothetical protein VFY88_08710 [Intrasporangium sp.]|nr:hypothetical protein [Intrasporangium sp.]